jgi:cytochrome c oxidase subunit 3
MSATAEHADHHGPIAWPKDPQYGLATPGKIAMWLFLCSDAFSFAGLLLAYGILRGGSKAWPPDPSLAEPSLGINFTAGLTFLLICSSVTMVLAHAAAVEGNRKKTAQFLGLTILGGILFLFGQYQEYWGIWSHGLLHEGLKFGASHYANTFYVTTGFHGMHVFSGVLYLTVIFVRTLMGKYDHGKHDHIEIVGLFWHFVDLVWILVFTFIYLL